MIATKARAARQPSDRRWTFDEMVAELPESNLPVELWDGEIIMSPMPSFLHQELVGRWRPGERAESRRLKGLTVQVSDLFSQD